MLRNHTHCQVPQKANRTNQNLSKSMAAANPSSPQGFWSNAQKNKINLCFVDSLVRFENECKMRANQLIYSSKRINTSIQHAIKNIGRKVLNLNNITINKRLGNMIGRSFEMPYVSYCHPLTLIRMKFITTVGLIIIASNIFSQSSFDSTKISKETFEIVKEVAKYHGIGTKSAGFGGQPSQGYLPQKRLKENGSIEEFVELTKHPSIMVRYVAFQMVVNVDTFNFIKHIEKSLIESEWFGGMAGCMAYFQNYTDYLISAYLQQQNNSQESRSVVDSILIYNYIEPCYVSN